LQALTTRHIFVLTESLYTNSCSLLQLAREKYLSVLGLKPDDHVVLANLGWVLGHLASLQPDAADRLRTCKQSFEKFEASLALRSQDAKTLVMWADSCLSIAFADVELESSFGLLDKAYELSYRADELCEGIGSYTIGMWTTFTTCSG
jgi:hypothetical protein